MLKGKIGAIYKHKEYYYFIKINNIESNGYVHYLFLDKNIESVAGGACSNTFNREFIAATNVEVLLYASN